MSIAYWYARQRVRTGRSTKSDSVWQTESCVHGSIEYWFAGSKFEYLHAQWRVRGDGPIFKLNFGWSTWMCGIQICREQI